ncbi:MAG: AlpA family phage regulatory protein [Sedimenticolaceae bacterium]
MELTGLSRSTIYAMIKRGEFPENHPIGSRAVAWREAEVLQWLRDRGVYPSSPRREKSRFRIRTGRMEMHCNVRLRTGTGESTWCAKNCRLTRHPARNVVVKLAVYRSSSNPAASIGCGRIVKYRDRLWKNDSTGRS